MAKQISADFEKASYARRVNFLLFRRTIVRRDDRKFTATKQVSEHARLRMESFYDAIIFNFSLRFIYQHFDRDTVQPHQTLPLGDTLQRPGTVLLPHARELFS